MFKPESFGSGSAETVEPTETAENFETPRALSQARGEKSLDATRESLLKRKAELKAGGVDEATIKSASGSMSPESRTSVEVPSNSAETAEAEISPAELGNKAKKNPIFRKAITGIVIGLVASATLGGIAAHNMRSANAAVGGGVITETPTITMETPAMAPAETSPQVITFGETAEAEKGIKDGYDQEGMWLDASKPNTVAFSDFEKVVNKFNGNVKEALKYTDGNEVEALSDYISALPDGVSATLAENSVLSKFKGLSELDTNDKIENQLSEDEYSKLKQEFNSLIDRADVKEVTLNGRYTNAYMAVKDGSNLLGSKAAIDKGIAINHEGMQLIACHTNEKNTKAYEFSWKDENGKVLGSMLVKGSCAQAVEIQGSSKRFAGLPEAATTSLGGGGPITIITGGGPNPTPNPKPNPTPNPKPDPKPNPKPDPDPKPDPKPDPDPKDKWGKTGDPHGGDLVTPSDLVDPNSEVSKEYIENVNEGNRGYIDDGGAAPGSSSESNGVNPDTGFSDTGITAPGASTEEGRLGGGENQGGDSTNGENAYHDESSESAGRSEDNSGNDAQEEAQENNETGGDNNSDKEEESRVAEGNF